MSNLNLGFHFHDDLGDALAEANRLAQPKAAYDFLSKIKSLAEQKLDFDARLPGLVQIIELYVARVEFMPEGHFKQIFARLLFEDGRGRNVMCHEIFLPQGGEVAFTIIPEANTTQQ